MVQEHATDPAVVWPTPTAVLPVRIRLLVAVLVGVVASVVPVRMAFSAPRTRLVLLARSGSAAGQAIDFPATHLGVTWAGAEDARVQVRWRAGGTWSHWTDTVAAGDLRDSARGISYSGLLAAPGATRAETRVVGGDARDVKVAAIDTEHGPRHLMAAAGPAATAAPGDPATAAPIPPTPPGPPEPPVVTRTQWGADESMRKSTPPIFAPVTKLIVHHTATANNDPDPMATVRAIYAFHTQVRGWDDIGYNFLIDAQGRVYEGRWARTYDPGEVPTGEDLSGNGVVGAHAEGVNTGSAGVALLGDFTSAMPTAAAMAGLESFLAWKAGRDVIDPAGASLYRATNGTTSRFPNIAGHRDVTATDCPGDVLYRALPGLRQRLSLSQSDAAARTVRGYWIAGAGGAVYAFGAAPFLGDAKAAVLTRPIRGMAATPSQRGYWLLGGDGGIFAFGDAAFYGSTGAIKLNKPVVGMASTPTGKGYWLVASDGGIFAFGDAAFAGSTGAIALNSPIVAMHAAGDGNGYWLVARDGGVFAFGVLFAGSVPGLHLASYAGSASLRATPGGLGYFVLGADGGVFSFGDATFFGARPGLSGATAAVDLAVYDVPVALG